MRYIAASLLALGIPLIAAEELKTYNHRKAKFSISYPSDWQLVVDQAGVPVTVSAPDNSASVQILTQKAIGDVNACDFLAKNEAASPDAGANLIPAEKRTLPPEHLKNLGVNNACLGAYKKTSNGAEILQGVSVYVRGKQIWLITQSLPVSVQEKYARPVGEIVRSFVLK